ncbi:hypothetical protein C1645_835213 [Glomus cerebriforme]|uniref:Uncharacterized protein n=1 Tax=Glomus cerebriforme TaxID=658196 RepID=A0A397SCH8_9GLOM|nr:hypothetical protein C1645_835213 [Glomus cerebriforme]
MAGVSKRKKHIKKLAAEKKRKKHVQAAETNLNVKNNEESLGEIFRDLESDDEIIWGDDDLDNNQEDLIQILMTQMQNYVPPTRRSTYTGNSSRTKRRHQSEESEKSEESEDDYDHSQQVINSLETQLKEKNLDEDHKLRLTAILQYMRLLEFQNSKLEASLSVAHQLKKGPWFARCLRLWSHMLQNGESIPFSKREKHCKVKSLLDDEDVQMQITSYLREKKFEFYVADFVDYVTNTIFPSLGIETKTTISETTARNWLKKMGYHYKKYQKGVYVDGHEREDVVDYQKLMPIFEGDEMEIQINPDLQPGEQIHILVTHYETTFHSNDGRNAGWAPDHEQPLRKKGQGRAIHISDFICETIGRLQLNEEQRLSEIGDRIPHEARVIMNPGKNHDGWWTVEKLVEQIIQRAIPIFETTHPNAIGIFAFDNSTSHGAFAPDALIASRMNVNPGGKQPRMRNTIFNEQVQSMNFPDDYFDEKLRGKPKGMRQVLEERQLMKPGLTGYCRNNESKDTQCCMRHILENQPDFLAQKGMIQEVIEEQGHKKYSRKNCDYTWTGLQRVVPIALNQVPLSHIRAFARKSYRYMDAYRKGLDVKQAEYAVKPVIHNNSGLLSMLQNIHTQKGLAVFSEINIQNIKHISGRCKLQRQRNQQDINIYIATVAAKIAKEFKNNKDNFSCIADWSLIYIEISATELYASIGQSFEYQEQLASKINLRFDTRYLGSTVNEKFQGLIRDFNLMDNYVKEKGERITRLSKRYYEEFLSIFWKKLVSDYVKIHEKNMVTRMASNDAAKILVLLNKLGESANVTLRDVDKENK